MPATTSILLRKEESRTEKTLTITGHQALPKLMGADTEGAAAIALLKVPPLSGPPLHVHTREDEWFYVLHGQITFQLGGRTGEHGPGSSVLAPRGVPHAFQNFSNEVAEVLVMFTPANLEEFFLRLDGREMDPIRAATLMAEYGITLLGPPLAK